LKLKLSVVIPSARASLNTIRTNCSALAAAGFGTDAEVVVACTPQNEQTVNLQLNVGFDLPTVVVSSLQPQASAGQLRNTALPHAKGDYICFLDDDDLIDGHALREALESAESNSWDVVCFPYVTSGTQGEWGGGPMLPPDVATWQLIQANYHHCSLRSQLALLGNYPWIRLTKKALLASERIRFGSSVVHNDILFHWHSLACAKNFGVFLKPVCSHTFHSSGQQLTTLRDRRRLKLFDELAATHKRLRSHENFPELQPAWTAFCKEVSGWARAQIASEHLKAFDTRENKFWDEIHGDGSSTNAPHLLQLAQEVQLSRRHRFQFLHSRAVDAFLEVQHKDGDRAPRLEPVQERLRSRILSNIDLGKLRPEQKKRLLEYYRQRLNQKTEDLVG
jgi:glycosyltransferase involved in cell wall biosynthesis